MFLQTQVFWLMYLLILSTVSITFNTSLGWVSIWYIFNKLGVCVSLKQGCQTYGWGVNTHKTKTCRDISSSSFHNIRPSSWVPIGSGQNWQKKKTSSNKNKNDWNGRPTCSVAGTDEALRNRNLCVLSVLPTSQMVDLQAISENLFLAIDNLKEDRDGAVSSLLFMWGI